MLVLTRKLMEKLFIGDDICVTVVRLEGGQVRLGIDAPRDVAVVRAELVPNRHVPRGQSAPPHRPVDGSQPPQAFTIRGSWKRYPTPRTVSMSSPASPSFFLRLLM